MKATTSATVALPSSLEVSMLPIAELHASALNPRKAMDAAQLAELAQSIAEIGVTNPVLVRPPSLRQHARTVQRPGRVGQVEQKILLDPRLQRGSRARLVAVLVGHLLADRVEHYLRRPFSILAQRPRRRLVLVFRFQLGNQQRRIEADELLAQRVLRKVHKHQVQKPAARGAAGRDWKAEEEKREAEQIAYVARETPIREAVVAAIRKDGKAKTEERLRFLLVEFAGNIGDCDRIAALRGIKACDRIAALRGIKACGQWDRDAIMKGVAKAAAADLGAWARDVLVGSSVNPLACQYQNVAQDREGLWAAAKLYGVNADAIAKSFEKAKMPSPKAPVKTPTSSPARKVKAKPVKAKAAKKAVRK